jgi:hypothetical protein
MFIMVAVALGIKLQPQAAQLVLLVAPEVAA